MHFYLRIEEIRFYLQVYNFGINKNTNKTAIYSQKNDARINKKCVARIKY